MKFWTLKVLDSAHWLLLIWAIFLLFFILINPIFGLFMSSIDLKLRLSSVRQLLLIAHRNRCLKFNFCHQRIDIVILLLLTIYRLCIILILLPVSCKHTSRALFPQILPLTFLLLLFLCRGLFAPRIVQICLWWTSL